MQIQIQKQKLLTKEKVIPKESDKLISKERDNLKIGKLKIIVQIPAFNEEKTIAKVIKGIPRNINNFIEVKILVSDDNSSDNTINVARLAGADYILRSKVNSGLGKNFRRAIEASLKKGADIIVNIDADGQFNSADVPRLIEPIINKEADMVTASRFINKETTINMPWIKKWGNKRYTKLINGITGKDFTDVSCGYRAYSKEAALRLNLQGAFTYTQETFIDLVEKGMKIKEIPLEVKYFNERNSKISGNLSRYGIKSLAIIGRATRDAKPLSFFGIPGLIVFGLGAIGGLFSFFYWLLEHVTTPIRTLFSLSVFCLTFGVSLLILALVADMLKSIKRNQDEILYRLKLSELEHKKRWQSPRIN